MLKRALALAGRLGPIIACVLMGGVVSIMTMRLSTMTKERDALDRWRVVVIRATSSAVGAPDGRGAYPQLDQADVPVEIAKLAADRDRLRTVVKVQTIANRSLSDETARAKAQSSASLARVKVITTERDRWIATADAKAKGRDWGTCEDELRKAEDAIDALYRDSF